MAKWLQSQIEFLKENYSKIPTKEISLKINHPVSSVQQLASKLKLKHDRYNEWSELDVEILTKEYPMLKKSKLESILNRGWSVIRKKASMLGLKRLQKKQDLIIGSCQKLLQETPESFYWLGFLLADGHFSKIDRLCLSLAPRDEEHLKQYAKFLESKVRYSKNAVTCSVLDKYHVNLIKEKFDISNQKTYFPPNLSVFNYSQDLLISLIIGFIDGDGNITCQTGRKDTSLRVKCHKSWLPFLLWIKDILEKEFGLKSGSPKINNQGYASVTFANHELQKRLKLSAIKMRLPIMKRKWDKIEIT
jgi:hypothetical protein